MDTAGLMGISGNGMDSATGAASAREMGKDAFMQLLVTQLKNQDPFQPMDSQEFAAQLAQFSALEQTQNMSNRLENLARIQQESFGLQSLTQGSALLGKEIAYLDPVTGETRTGLVESVEVKDGIVTLKAGDAYVPLASITGVNAPAEA